jgi:hypothetical protein
VTDIKPVYTPITTTVDNNTKPSSGSANGGTSPGLLRPSPNTAWVPGVVKKDAETMAKREAFMNGGAMGDRDGYKANQLATASSQATISQATQQAQQQEGSANLLRTSDIVEDAHESSKKSLEAEAKHDEQVAEAKEKALAQLRAEDLQKEQAQPLATPQVTAGA